MVKYVSQAGSKMFKIKSLAEDKDRSRMLKMSRINLSDSEREFIRKFDEKLLAQYDDARTYIKNHGEKGGYYRNKDVDKYRGKKQERYHNMLSRDLKKRRRFHNIDGRTVDEVSLTPEDKQYLREKYKRKKFVSNRGKDE